MRPRPAVSCSKILACSDVNWSGASSCSRFAIVVSSSLDGSFHHRLQIGQALLEIAAHHLVEAHEQADRPTDEIVVPAHAPGDDGRGALRAEGGLGGAGAFH